MRDGQPDPLDRIWRRISIWLGLELDDDVLNALDAKERLARYHRSRMQAPLPTRTPEPPQDRASSTSPRANPSE